MRAVRVHRYGDPEVLTPEEVTTPVPGAGEALVRVDAIGVNFVDIYHRIGLYPGALPFIPGAEAAGTVEMVGRDVAVVKVGDPVVYATQLGAYAEYAVVPAWKLVRRPAGLDGRTAAAAMLTGLTAHYLTHSTYPLKRGDVALVHAAAGAAGSLLVQIAKRLGATVIGTVSTEEKAQVARELGADLVIRYRDVDFAAAVKEATNGRGVDVVYDSVGKDTFAKSLDCLRPRGCLVFFGQASGPIQSVDPLVLMNKGSLYLTRPTLRDYIATRDELLERAGTLFDWIRSGDLKVRVARTYPLQNAAEAHKQLEGRMISGKILLLPHADFPS